MKYDLDFDTPHKAFILLKECILIPELRDKLLNKIIESPQYSFKSLNNYYNTWSKLEIEKLIDSLCKDKEYVHKFLIYGKLRCISKEDQTLLLLVDHSDSQHNLMRNPYHSYLKDDYIINLLPRIYKTGNINLALYILKCYQINDEYKDKFNSLLLFKKLTE